MNQHALRFAHLPLPSHLDMEAYFEFVSETSGFASTKVITNNLSGCRLPKSTLSYSLVQLVCSRSELAGLNCGQVGFHSLCVLR